MRRFLPILAAALSCVPLSACATLGVPASPGTVADQTKIDEQAGLTITLAYTAASRAAALAIRTADAIGKPFPPATVQHIGQLDSRAYAAVQAAHEAYAAANASGYLAGLQQARAAIADLLAAVKGN